jgi:transposase
VQAWWTEPVGQEDYRPRRREQRGYDGGKKVKGRKRHLLVDTQGLVLKARVHSAKVQDLKRASSILLEFAPERLPRLCHLWMDAGYTGEGKGADWAEKVLGWTAQIVRHPPKLAREEVMRRWVKGWAKEGVCRSIRRSSQGRGGSGICLGDGWWSAPFPGWGKIAV